MEQSVVEIPVVTEFTFSQALFSDRVEADFRCPHCASRLKAQEAEVGIVDVCPNCNGSFVLGDEAIAVIEQRTAEREEAANSKRRIALEKKQAADERRAEKERLRQERESQKPKCAICGLSAGPFTPELPRDANGRVLCHPHFYDWNTQQQEAARRKNRQLDEERRRLEREREAAEALANPMKQCPYCAETILRQARKCRFCGEKLGSTQEDTKRPQIAAVLSFVVPGLGQIYNGAVLAGVVSGVFCGGLYILGTTEHESDRPPFIAAAIVLHLILIATAVR